MPSPRIPPSGPVSDFEAELPNAAAWFMDDFEVCIAHLRMPITHRRAIRTTNLIERSFVEERRRFRIIPNAFGHKAALKLVFCCQASNADPCESKEINRLARRSASNSRAEQQSEQL